MSGQSKKFDFKISGMPDKEFMVVEFNGREALSEPYRFEITLISENPEVDLEKAIQGTASFTILRQDDKIPFNGRLLEFEQLQKVEKYYFYRAVLVPRMYWLNYTHHNQVFLNKTLKQFIEEAMKDGGLTSADYSLKLQKNYSPWEYICQYGESHFDFISRWMEREGIYYYFEQGDSDEKIILTDSSGVHKAMSQGKTVIYSPPSGLDDSRREEVVQSIVCRQKNVPSKVKIKDYNYRKPTLEITGEADVSPRGMGVVYLYAEHARTPEEANALAKVRAEEYLARERVFHGESLIPYLRPGYVFKLDKHYRSDFNVDLLTIELEHSGNQMAMLAAGLREALSVRESEPYYRNAFTAIPAGKQFRPERKTQKARFYGSMNATVDAESSGPYAEIDEQGRYKIKLPFDASGAGGGKGSSWIRMAQPYAGKEHGMHFPLHKESEVLLTFIDGDPDRPIISGALPHAEAKSVVTGDNPSTSQMKTKGGNIFSMRDTDQAQGFVMQTPGNNSLILASGDSLCAKQMPSDWGAPGIDPSVASINYSGTDCLGEFSKYYIGHGDLINTVLSSFSWSASSNCLLVSLILNYAKAWSTKVALEEKLGKIKEGDYPPYLSMVVPAVAAATRLFVTNLGVYSMSKYLEKANLVKRPLDTSFGSIDKRLDAKGYRSGASWFFSRIGSTLYNFVLGPTGSYGAILMTHVPYDGDWQASHTLKGLFNPKCVSYAMLNKGAPDLLLATSCGHADIMGMKGINLLTAETALIEGPHVKINCLHDFIVRNTCKGHVGGIVIDSYENKGIMVVYDDSLLRMKTDESYMRSPKIRLQCMERRNAKPEAAQVILDGAKKTVEILAKDKINVVAKNIMLGADDKGEVIKIGKSEKSNVHVNSNVLNCSAAKNMNMKANKNMTVEGSGVEIKSRKDLKMTVTGNTTINGQKIKLC